MEVNFLLPHFGLEPTGGFKIAYYYANYLSQKGYNVNIIHTASLKNNIKKYPKYIIAYFNKIKCKQRWFEFDKNINLMYVPMINDSTIPNADITVATAWQTAELLEGLKLSKGKKIYLIQHYEIWNGKKEDVDRTWQYSDMNKIVISKWLMEIADKMQINKYTYIPNSLDHNKFILNQQVEKREKVISMMYSDVEWKGSIDGIEAFENIKKEINDISVKIFGKCKRPDNLPVWIKYYENPSQDILVNEIYNKSSIFLCTSWYEGWGLPPMEAMACGCAVVTTNNGGVLDFAIDGETALVCEPKNVYQITEALVKLLKNDELRINLALQGINKVNTFRWEESFAKFEKLIRTVMNSNN